MSYRFLFHQTCVVPWGRERGLGSSVDVMLEASTWKAKGKGHVFLIGSQESCVLCILEYSVFLNLLPNNLFLHYATFFVENNTIQVFMR